MQAVLRAKLRLLRRRLVRRMQSTLPVPAQCWERWPICRRSRCGRKSWMRVPICSRLEQFCMRWRRGRYLFTAKPLASFSKPSSILIHAPDSFQSRYSAQAGRHHQQGAGEGSQSPLSGRGGNASRPATAEARYRDGTSQSCEFRHSGGRTGKQLSGRPTAVASIWFLACASSICII